MNFNLAAGDFLWVKFKGDQVLELGQNTPGNIVLNTGINAFGYSQFPSGYSAFKLIRQLGLDNVHAVRMLDSGSGYWRVAEVRNGTLIGHDFSIPATAVLFIDMNAPVTQWKPQ